MESITNAASTSPLEKCAQMWREKACFSLRDQYNPLLQNAKNEAAFFTKLRPGFANIFSYKKSEINKIAK